ncbi:MAG: thrombospondin type 3 repeat-containing protein, partial [candidate division Zixibacteria bacterium]|nr:thrombospondin type 3 repeat-containing protein [candidate division Zixibacteria bacterium]
VDGDVFCGDIDNCPSITNPFQTDSDNDGIGDVCDDCPGDNINDPDGDGLCATVDNCPLAANAAQTDTDGDGVGDVCDVCVNDPNPLCCCKIAGDADNSASVNIGDVTFLIARIFAGGPGPPCCAEGDADGSGAVNIADITYLIARIFAGGPAPACGPAGMGC